MNVYVVRQDGGGYCGAEAVYAHEEDARRHCEVATGSFDVEEWLVWTEFTEDRFTKKGYLRADVVR